MQTYLDQSIIAQSVIDRTAGEFGKKIGFFGKVFGCWHKDLSRPFSTKGKSSYRVCTGCGARRKFNTKSLETTGPFYYPPSVASVRF